MKFDFSQPAPRAQSLEGSQRIIDALWNYAIECQTSQKGLASKITDLEEKLNTSSRNSSLPPSSDLFKKKKPKKNNAFHHTHSNHHRFVDTRSQSV